MRMDRSEMEFREHEPVGEAQMQRDLLRVRPALVIAKRGLMDLLGVMVLAAVSFSSTLPRSLWPAEQNGDDVAVNHAVKPASRGSSVAAHAERSRKAEKSKPDSSAAKTAKRIDQKTAQAALVPAGCKDQAPAHATPVAGGKSTSRKTHTNSTTSSTQEKSLCNPESPRSR